MLLLVKKKIKPSARLYILIHDFSSSRMSINNSKEKAQVADIYRKWITTKLDSRFKIKWWDTLI